MKNSVNKKLIIILILIAIIVCISILVYFKLINKNKVEQDTVSSISTKFKATIYTITQEQGGSNLPLFDKARREIYFTEKGITGIIILPDNIKRINPGDTADVDVELESPVNMKIGSEFSIKNGEYTIGYGKVVNIY